MHYTSIVFIYWASMKIFQAQGEAFSFTILLWIIFLSARIESGDPIKFGSNTDLDPKKLERNTAIVFPDVCYKSFQKLRVEKSPNGIFDYPFLPNAYTTPTQVRRTTRSRHYSQCCGSGSGIRCLFGPWIRDPGSGIGFFRIPELGSRIPRPYFFKSFLTIFLIKSSIIV